MKDPSAIRKTSISLREDLHWQFKQTAALRHMSEKAAIEEAIERWIGSESRAELEHLEHLDTLARMLRSGDTQLVVPLLKDWARKHATATEEEAEPGARDRPKVARAR